MEARSAGIAACDCLLRDFYSDSRRSGAKLPGVLDDYAFAVIACLDAYEATADLSYFRFARAIADAMVAGFFDSADGGFFDTRVTAEGQARARHSGDAAEAVSGFADSGGKLSGGDCVAASA